MRRERDCGDAAGASLRRSRHSLRRGRPGTRRSGPGERGAAALEFALAAGVFFFLIFGVIDFAMTVFDANATDAGAREGAHAAGQNIGANPAAGSTCRLGPLTMTYPGVAPGDELEAETQLKRVLCRTKDRLLTAGGGRSRVRVRFENEDGGTDNGVVTDLNKESYIVVCVQTQAQSVSGLFTPVMKRITLSGEGRDKLQYVYGPNGEFKLASGGETFFDTSPAKAC